MTADIHTLTGGYVLDALSDEERRAFEDHLARCAECNAEVNELRETAARLGGAVAAEPPAALKAHVLDDIRRVRQLPPDEGPIIPIRGRKWPLRAAALAAAAAVIAAIALGAQVIRLNQQLDEADQQAGEFEARYDTLIAVLTADDAEVVTSRDEDMAVTVVVAPSSGKLAFVPQQLPEPGDDSTYQLWLIGPDGAQSAGLVPEPARPVVTNTAPGTDRLGVTIEPAGGSDQPTTTPVLLLALP